MNAPAFPAPRVAPRLSHAFGGIWRLTFRRWLLPSRWLGVGGCCLLMFLFSIPLFVRGGRVVPISHAAFLNWAVMMYLTFLVPILAFITAATAMRDEMKAGTVNYVFTRPLSRAAFVGFKFLAHLICAQLDFLVGFGVLVGIGAYHHVPDLGAGLPAIFGTQVLVVTAFSAFGFLSGMVTSRFIVVGLAYGAIVDRALGNIPTQINKLSLTHQVKGMLHDFLTPGRGPFMPAPGSIPDGEVGSTIVLLLGFTAIMLFTAAAIFSFMELSGPNES